METTLPCPQHPLGWGGGGLTLQMVAVCCSQMVSSSMSNTWHKGNRGSGCEVTAHPLESLEVPQPSVGSPDLIFPWFMPVNK